MPLPTPPTCSTHRESRVTLRIPREGFGKGLSVNPPCPLIHAVLLCVRHTMCYIMYMKHQTSQLNLRISTPLRDAVAELARTRYTSVSALIREALLNLLDSDPRGISPHATVVPVVAETAATSYVSPPHKANGPVTWT